MKFHIPNFMVPNKKKGQALVMLLVFMIVAIIVTTASVAILLINSLAAAKLEQGTEVLTVAESGVENALLLILRNPNYTVTGLVLPVGSGNANVTVTGTSTKTILSIGQEGNFVRKVQAIASFDANHQLRISSWAETY